MSGHPDDDAHIASCEHCQAWVALEGLDVDLNRAWGSVAANVWTSPIGRVEHGIGWLLGSRGLARAIVTTPSLVLSWVLASAFILAVGVVATHSTGEPWFALIAPALAGIGIAYAYGPGVDPAFELAQTMAISDRMVLLARVVAVFAVNAALGLIASLVSDGAVGLTLGWLLPMTMVSALGLAAASLTHSANTGVGAVLSGWGLIVLASASRTDDIAAAVDAQALSLLYVVGAVLFGIVAIYATGGSRWNRDRSLQWR